MDLHRRADRRGAGRIEAAAAGRHGSDLPDGQQLDDIADYAAARFSDVVELQAAGRDYMTVHCGLLREHLPLTERRLTGIVSRGGALVAKWMQARAEQNPFYTHFDDLCDIMREYDVTWSLGDGLRPGSIADASDEAQFAELKVMGELGRRARQRNCQVMIEGPGHVPMDQIERNVRLEQQWCDEAPFYVLGPIVTDIARLRPHHQRHWRGAGGVVWSGDALLRDAQGAPRAAEPRRRASGSDRLQDCGPRGRPGAAPAGRARAGRRHEQGPIRVRLGGAVPPGARSGDGPADARRIASRRGAQEFALLQHVRSEVLLDEDHEELCG